MVPQRSVEPITRSAAVNARPEERTRRHRARDDIHGGVEVAIAERLARGFFRPLEGAVHDRRLEHARIEEQPFEIGSAARIADRDIEPRLREGVGEIAADRRHLGDGHVAVAQRRHLAHRIDLEIVRLPVVALFHAEHVQVERFADLLQHPMDDRGARGSNMIKRKGCHRRSFLRCAAACGGPDRAPLRS